MDWPRELRDARYLLLKKRPYLAAVLMNLPAYEVPDLPSIMAVDSRWNLYYRKQEVESLPVDQLAAVLYHEVWHLLATHYERLAHYPQAVANAGGDLAINSNLAREGFQLPKGSLLPSLFNLPDDKSAEWYCDQLMQSAAILVFGVESRGSDQQSDSGGNQSQSQHQSGAGQGDSSQQCGQQSAEPNQQSSTVGSQRSSASGKVMVPDHGSAADGRPRPYEAASGMPEPMQKALVKEAAEAVLREKSRGTVPDHLARWAEQVLDSRLDWRQLLRSALRGELESAMSRIDYSWRGRNRRQGFTDALLPVLRSPIPRVALLIDTSGSMSAKELGMALAEVRAVLKLLPEVEVYSADAELQTVQKVFSHRQVKLIGGGGTDMRLAVRQLFDQRRKPKPELLVVITDGYTDWPEPVKGVRMVAALTAHGGTKPPDHIRCIDISKRDG